MGVMDAPLLVPPVGGGVVPASGVTSLPPHVSVVPCAPALSQFFSAMLDGGITLPPSQFETWFVSAEHSDELIDKTIDACRDAMKAVARTRD